MSESVEGYCPMGCGRTLFVGSGGYVTCSYIKCPNPSAVAELLEDREANHVAVLRDDDFTLRHPLSERLHDELETCDVHARIAALDGPPRKPGRYRVIAVDETEWYWIPLDQKEKQA